MYFSNSGFNGFPIDDHFIFMFAPQPYPLALCICVFIYVLTGTSHAQERILRPSGTRSVAEGTVT